jgi:pimeloyl-ACP methyl ester carboxylesterase
MTGGERIIEANGVPLCVETTGDPGDPAVLLIHGASASLLWWDRELCERIAGGGRFVIRYDSRDTGRSVSYPPGRPGYRLTDLADDAIGILDALGVHRAHLVGRSMGGRPRSWPAWTTRSGSRRSPSSAPRLATRTCHRWSPR